MFIFYFQLLIRCAFDGYPWPTYSWVRDGEILTSGDVEPVFKVRGKDNKIKIVYSGIGSLHFDSKRLYVIQLLLFRKDKIIS